MHGNFRTALGNDEAADISKVSDVSPVADRTRAEKDENRLVPGSY